MNEGQLRMAVEANYQIVFFYNGYGCYSLQSSSINNFLNKRNFRSKEIDLSIGAEILIPYANDWHSIEELFVAEKTKTIFVAVGYKGQNE